MRDHQVAALLWAPDGGAHPFYIQDGVLRPLFWRQGSTTWDAMLLAIRQRHLPPEEAPLGPFTFGKTQIVQMPLASGLEHLLPAFSGGSWRVAALGFRDNDKLAQSPNGVLWDFLDLCPSVAWGASCIEATLSPHALPILTVGVQRVADQRSTEKGRHMAPHLSTVSCTVKQTNYQVSALPGRPPRQSLLVKSRSGGEDSFEYGKQRGRPCAEFVQAMEQFEVIQWVVNLAISRTLHKVTSGPYQEMTDAIRGADTLEELFEVAADPRWLAPVYLPGWELLVSRMDRLDPIHAGQLRRLAYVMANAPAILSGTLEGEAASVLGALKDTAQWRRPVGPRLERLKVPVLNP